MRKILALLPLAAVVLPWLTLRAMGGREAVVVLTGMLPAGMGPEAAVLGLAYVFAHLLLMVAGPPLACFAVVTAVQR